MKNVATRGTALVETALTVGLALLLVLGAAQMAIIGYTQISADGAAFLAARAQAENPSANGVTTATSIFSNFSSSNFSTPSPSPSLVPYSVTKSVGGFSLMPGLSSTYSVTGKDVEYAPAGGTATPAPYTFSINPEYLLNYCDPTKSCSLPSNYTIYLAQGIGNGNGNGITASFPSGSAIRSITLKSIGRVRVLRAVITPSKAIRSWIRTRPVRWKATFMAGIRGNINVRKP
jgi:hypothetical protein